MRLFIAEKPSLGKDIAGVLGVTGKGDGHLICGTTKVTWCFGHMLEQASPDEYTPDDVPINQNGNKVWRIDELPIIPKKWILNPRADANKQLKIIGSLIKEADEIVNAGDPDREGQLLIEEVLSHHSNNIPVKRFWVSATDPVTIKRGLDDMKKDSLFSGWADAARGRQRADWLIGMNLSRAYTLRAMRGGARALLTVGRVQTPTLTLVVNRDREIEAFVPISYHTIRAEIQYKEGLFKAKWKAAEEQPGLDSEERLIDTKIADELVSSFANKTGQITSYEQQPKKQKQPLSLALSDVVLWASNKYGYSGDEVLAACQALYETHKLTSYPRSDSCHLPETQHADAPQVLEAVRHVNPELISLIDGCDPMLKSKTWDDSKVTAHHGIIPTLYEGNKAALDEREKNIYGLIVRAYLAQFYPVHEFMSTTVWVEIEGERFSAKGRVVTNNGWRDIYSEKSDGSEGKQDESETQALPSFTEGDSVSCLQAIRMDAKTKAPARFKEGTLTKAMENIHKFVTDTAHKKILREGDGIGTSATRTSILSELKRREYLVTKGKNIISTTLGRSVVDALPEVVKSPVLTALFERMLKGIEQGTAALADFSAKQETFVKEQVEKANVGAVVIAGGKEMAAVSEIYKCTTCATGLSRRPSKKKGHFWWGCSNYPACKQTYPDFKGRPNYSKGRNEPVLNKE